VAGVVLVDRRHDGGECFRRLGDRFFLFRLGFRRHYDGGETLVDVTAPLASPDGFDDPVGREQQDDKQDNEHD